LESNFSLKDANNKEVYDLLEPQATFHLAEFLKSSKVANLHSSGNNHPLESKASDTRRDYIRDIAVIESISNISINEL
jgi:hypothetical protein